MVLMMTAAATIPTETQSRATGGCSRQFTARLEALHAASDKGDQAATEAELKKLQPAYILIDAQLPKQDEQPK